jgi:Bacterial SH3 domain
MRFWQLLSHFTLIPDTNDLSCAVIPGGKNCRRVDSIIGAPVRTRPSINSAAIRTLGNGKSVTLGDRRSNGWVEITAPVNGYVAAVNLGYCEPE